VYIYLLNRFFYYFWNKSWFHILNHRCLKIDRLLLESRNHNSIAHFSKLLNAVLVFGVVFGQIGIFKLLRICLVLFCYERFVSQVLFKVENEEFAVERDCFVAGIHTFLELRKKTQHYVCNQIQHKEDFFKFRGLHLNTLGFMILINILWKNQEQFKSNGAHCGSAHLVIFIWEIENYTLLKYLFNYLKRSGFIFFVNAI
jgi:hypothetical protein